MSDANLAADGFGTISDFQHGSIYAHPQIGPRVLQGVIRDKYLELGAEHSNLGYPVRDQFGLQTVTVTNDPGDLRTAPRANTVPNIWVMFQNGAIAATRHGAGAALKSIVPPEKLRQFVRRQFDEKIKAQNQDIGLDPDIQTPSVIEWDFNLVQSAGRSAFFRLSGFHRNDVVSDTVFVIELGLHIGLKVDETPTDVRTLFASLLPGSLRVQAIGIGADTLQRGLTAGLQVALADPLPLFNLPVAYRYEPLNLVVWAVVDVCVTADGGLAVLTMPTPDETLDGLIQSATQAKIDSIFSP